MDRKSLFYIGGGILLILSVVLSVFQGAIMTSSSILAYKELPPISWMFESGYFKYYMQNISGMQKLQLILPIIIGLALIVKGVLGDIVPDIALVGLFGIMALFAGVAFLKSSMALFREGNFWVKLVSVSTNLLMLIAYGGMAAIIFMKDSFGGFFFVPAASVGGTALLKLLLYGSVTSRKKAYLMGLVYLPFKFCLLIFLLDMVLVGALFAIGMAVVED